MGFNSALKGLTLSCVFNITCPLVILSYLYFIFIYF